MSGTGVNGWRFQAESAPKRALPGVRVRTALAAALVVALALGAGTAVLFFLLQRSVVHAIQDDQQDKIGAFVTLVTRQGNPQSLDDELKQNAPQGMLIQVVQVDDDQLVATSAYWDDQKPFTGLRPAPGQRLAEHAGPGKITDTGRPWIVLTAGATNDGTNYVIIMATSFQGQQQSLNRVLNLLLFGFPVLVLVVGLVTWVLIGRALRPVERIRARVAGISSDRLADRVPVPQTRDEIARLAVTMNAMLDRLDASQRTQRQFVSDASHELRSPLATMTASLDVAATDPSHESWPQLHDLMSAEVERMSQLVDNLLLLAKADDRGLVVGDVDVDLDDVVNREITRLRAASGLRVAALVRPARVQGDELQLSQVVRNLMDNAARHAEATVGVRLETVGTTAVLIVEDDGPGIPEEDRERVFERFVRLDESRERGSGGSGLGLAIVAEVVRAHRGVVSVREAPAGGAQLIVQLPALGAEYSEDFRDLEEQSRMDDAGPAPLAPVESEFQPPSVSSR